MIPLKEISDYESENEMFPVIAHDRGRAILVPREGPMMLYVMDDPEEVCPEGSFVHRDDAWPVCLLSADEEQKLWERYRDMALEIRRGWDG